MCIYNGQYGISLQYRRTDRYNQQGDVHLKYTCCLPPVMSHQRLCVCIYTYIHTYIHTDICQYNMYMYTYTLCICIHIPYVYVYVDISLFKQICIEEYSCKCILCVYIHIHHVHSTWSIWILVHIPFVTLFHQEYYFEFLFSRPWLKNREAAKIHKVTNSDLFSICIILSPSCWCIGMIQYRSLDVWERVEARFTVRLTGLT
jgi:hypothetical protein